PAAQQAQMTADAGVVQTVIANVTYTVTPLPRMAGAPVTETPSESTRVGQAIALQPTDAASLPATPSATSTAITEATTIALVPTLNLTTTSGGTSSPTSNVSPWVVVAIGLQVGVLGLAGAEYALRGRRKKR